jgi:hypothetical protein
MKLRGVACGIIGKSPEEIEMGKGKMGRFSESWSSEVTTLYTNQKACARNTGLACTYQIRLDGFGRKDTDSDSSKRHRPRLIANVVKICQ